MNGITPAEHRKLAIEANNSTWEFLDRSIDELTDNEIDEMTRRAYAAAYHWSRAENATVVNEIRASWLIAKVWIHQLRGEIALLSAQRCLTLCEQHEIGDFDLAYVYEVMARSLANLGKLHEARSWKERALSVPINDEEDAKLVAADLAKQPWFGLV